MNVYGVLYWCKYVISLGRSLGLWHMKKRGICYLFERVSNILANPVNSPQRLFLESWIPAT